LSQSLTIRFLIALWGVSGLCFILGKAVARLGEVAWTELRKAVEGGQMQTGHWVFLVAWVAYMGYAEGWRGFHKRVGPRTATRAFYLAEKRPVVHLIFAPIVVMALDPASRRTLIVRWCLVTGIVAVVLVVQQMPDLWRGMIDAGVVVGLAMGLCSVIYFFVRGLFGDVEELTDLPGSTPPPA
jgi:hypothetical protein